MKTLRFRRDQGRRYEDVYGGWLSLLREVAESDEPCAVDDVPPSWEPLIYYLGGVVLPPMSFALLGAERAGRLRELVEQACAARPELVDALYKSDMEWETKNRRHQHQTEFVVTNNGSFFRPEVLAFIERLETFEPTRRKCVLVPCAADKPYPAPLHKAVAERLPTDYHMIIATGVLGLVPEELWGLMPHYDSGIPNQWRLMKAVESYFGRHAYDRVVVYCDFYNEAILRGYSDVVLVNPLTSQYLDLLDPGRLRNLSRVLS